MADAPKPEPKKESRVRKHLREQPPSRVRINLGGRKPKEKN